MHVATAAQAVNSLFRTRIQRLERGSLFFRDAHQQQAQRLGPGQCFSSSGTFPPFSASLVITSLCNQMFIDAESLLSPV